MELGLEGGGGITTEDANLFSDCEIKVHEGRGQRRSGAKAKMCRRLTMPQLAILHVLQGLNSRGVNMYERLGVMQESQHLIHREIKRETLLRREGHGRHELHD